MKDEVIRYNMMGAPKGNLEAEREAIYKMLLQINASNPMMKKNSD